MMNTKNVLINNSRIWKRALVVKICLLLLVCVGVFFIFYLVPAFAGEAGGDGSGIIDKPTTYNNEFVYDLFTLCTIGNTLKLLNPQTGAAAAILSLSETLGTMFSSIALVWLTVKTMHEIIKMVVYNKISFDSFYKILIKFVITGFVLIMTPKILSAIDMGGTELRDVLIKHYTTGWDAETIQTAIQNSGNHFYAGMAGILAIFIEAYIKMTIYTIFIELAVRRVFAPFAVLNIISDGVNTRSAGMRFLIRYFIIYLRIVIILGIMFLVNGMLAHMNSVGWLGIFTPLFICCAGTRIIADSSKIANELLIGSSSFQVESSFRRA